eukprot:765636-Hanusia_phi.AAC.3
MGDKELLHDPYMPGCGYCLPSCHDGDIESLEGARSDGEAGRPTGGRLPPTIGEVLNDSEVYYQISLRQAGTFTIHSRLMIVALYRTGLSFYYHDRMIGSL